MFQDPELATYRWIITKDHTEDPDSMNNAAGTTGPHNLDPDLKSNPSTFSLYDDDDICYYEGMLYGEFEWFEPMDDYGLPNAGCVKMKLDGEWL